MARLKIQVPFYLISPEYQEIRGLLFLEKDFLGLEGQIKGYNSYGKIKPKSLNFSIPFVDILEVKYKRNLFLSQINVRVSKLTQLEAFPEIKNFFQPMQWSALDSMATKEIFDANLVFKIKRKDKDLALDLVSHIKRRISELKLNDLVDDEFD